MSCKRCGKCCLVYMIALELPDEVRRWLVYHGLNVMDQSEGKALLQGQSKCAMLYFTPEGQAACGVYEDRPGVCRHYLCERANEE